MHDITRSATKGMNRAQIAEVACKNLEGRAAQGWLSTLQAR